MSMPTRKSLPGWPEEPRREPLHQPCAIACSNSYKTSTDPSTRLRTGRTNPSPGVRRVMLAAIAASLVLSATLGLLLSRSRAARSDLERVLENSQAVLATRDETIDRQRELLDTLLAPNVSTASLVSVAPAAPRLQLFWNRDTDLLVVAAFNLPPAAPGRAYQLWGIQGDDPPVSLGLFDTGANDSTVTVSAPSSVPFDLAAVTEEPASGSQQPTSDPFLVGAWNHAD